MYPGSGATRSLSTLVWVDRQGREEALTAFPADRYFYPRLSANGARVVLGLREGTGRDGLWILDLERGGRTRITESEPTIYFPVWSPDAARVVSADSRGTVNRLISVAADGSGQIDVLLDRGERQFPQSWASDGHAIAMYVTHPETARDIWTFAVNDRRAVPFVTIPGVFV